MKLNSKLGRASIAFLEMLESKETFDEVKRASNRIKISAGAKLIESEAIQMNDELQHARIAERQERYSKTPLSKLTKTLLNNITKNDE